jgi:5-methyltetrahydrofolate--homocysteine methyltransferase
MYNYKKILKRKIIILDGATGMNLFPHGLKPGEPSCVLNLRNPEAVYDLQKRYVAAGSDVIVTNTLNANPLNFNNLDLARIIRQGVAIARRAAGGKPILADMGPLGGLLKPYGDMGFDEARRHFVTVCRLFRRLGVQDFILETFGSLTEAKAAFFAVREYGENIFVCFALDSNVATLMGEIPETIALTFDKLGAAGIGVNCTEPEACRQALARMARVTNRPLIAKPNAGKVTVRNGRVINSLTQSKLAAYFPEFVRAGANFIGGCCGTTPEYVKMIGRYALKPLPRKAPRKFYLAAPRQILDADRRAVVLVGERLNPSGRRTLRDGIRLGDYAPYAEDAQNQETKGVDVLDVNAFIPEIPETITMEKAVFEVVKNSSLPLFIDTQNFEAAQKIMFFYPGIGVCNSIPARTRELRKWLPLVKSSGFKAVISLVGKRVPRSCAERIANARTALAEARQAGLSRENLIFDPLVFPVASEPDQAGHTLATVKKLRKMGLATVLGISNVSFGMDNRSGVNAGFAVMAIHAGVRFLIVNPLDETVMCSIRGAVRLGGGTIDLVRAKFKETGAGEKGLAPAIIAGDAAAAADETERLLQTGARPQAIIDVHIVRALETVGENYQNGKFFLPDLMRSAEAAKKVMAIIKKHMPARATVNRGRIILATVKGDIHDIGKNIVAMLMASAGYEVIDLGKDVPTAKICAAVRRYQPDALGLSALLTTTMPEMATVIETLRRQKLKVRVIVGGPNVSDEYARQIGAFAAARNALDGLKILGKIPRK